MDSIAYKKLTGKSLEDKRDNWRSLCPVHDERTPSFYIHKETYLCHCFGCGIKGSLEYVLSRAYKLETKVVRAQLNIPVFKSDSIYESSAPEPDSFEGAWLSAYRRIEMHPYLKKRGFK